MVERKEPAAVGRLAVGEEGAGGDGQRRRWRGGAGRVVRRSGEKRGSGSTYQRVRYLLRDWFDILKRVGIDYKTNSLFLAQWLKHSEITARLWVRAPARAYFLATRIFLVALVQ